MLRKIEVLGDKYFLQKTFDIIDYHNAIYGFDVFDSNNSFLVHCDIGNKEDVISEIKWDIYRSLL